MTTDPKTQSAPTPDELDRDPSISFWLKRNWRMACERDPLDATRDAAALLQLCQSREERVFSEVGDDG
ncbi:MAG: hypothetical protein JKY27_06030 [Magnetovibrio sp.]|nr:hypothetical protein [Magnetovibrio sp.]